MLMRNPYNNGGVIRKDSAFYDRSELIDNLYKQDSGAYYIKGNRRIGKSSLLRSIERITIANPAVFPVYFNLEGASNAEEAYRFFLEALQNACRHKKLLRYETPEGFIESLSASVRHFNDQGMHYLLLIDEAENLMKLPGETLTILHRELVNMHDRLTVILSGTNRLQNLYQKTQGGVSFLENFQTRVIGCFSKEDAEALIRQTKNEEGEVKVSEEVIEQILQYAGTHPFLIQKLCHSLFQYGALREVKPEEDLVLDAQLSSFFDIDFDQLDAEHQQVLLQFRWDEGLSAEKIKGTPNISRSRTILRELEQLGFLRSENGVYWVGNYFLGLWLSERDDKPPLLELPQLLELAKRKRLNWENFFLFTAMHGAGVSEAEAREFFHNALDKVFKEEFYFNTNAESIVNQIKQDMQPLPDRLRHVWGNLLYLFYENYSSLFNNKNVDIPPHVYYPINNKGLRVKIQKLIQDAFPNAWTTQKAVWTYERWMQGEDEENFHQSYYIPSEMTFVEPEMPQEELDKIKQAKKDASKAHIHHHFEELKKELDVRIKDYKSPLDAFQSELKSLLNILAGEKDSGDLNNYLRYIISLFNLKAVKKENAGLKKSYEDWSVKNEDWLAQRVMPRHIGKIDQEFLEPYIFAIDKYRKHMEDSIRDYKKIEDASLDYLELEGLKQSAELLTKRINLIRNEKVTETDPSRKFKYDIDIERLEGERAALMEKINVILSRSSATKQPDKGIHEKNVQSDTVMKNNSTETFQQGHALLIGIQYGNRSKGRLPCTLSDVNGVANILTDRNKAAYPESQVVRLLEEHATTQGILDALDQLAQQVQSDSTVVIYYTGHGGQKGSKYYFLPYDYDMNLVYAETFTQKVKAIREKAQKVLVILDCCHAAGSSPLKSAEVDGQAFLAGIKDQLSAIDTSPGSTKQLDVSSLERGEGVVVLTSCKPNETSLAGNPYSLFTQAMIEVMEGRSKSTVDDGWVYIEDVKRYLDTHVPTRAAKHHRHAQNPVTDMNGVSGHFRVCAYDIVKAKGGGTNNSDPQINIENPMTNNETLFEKLKDLIDNDMDAAFEELEKVDWKNKKGTYVDLRDEWTTRPVGFSPGQFRSRLKLLLKSVLV